jgi:predicted nucleic acid-binding protein
MSNSSNLIAVKVIENVLHTINKRYGKYWWYAINQQTCEIEGTTEVVNITHDFLISQGFKLTLVGRYDLI